MAQHDYASELLGGSATTDNDAEQYDYASEVLGVSNPRGIEAMVRGGLPAVPRNQIAGSVMSRTLDAPGKNFLQKQVGSAKVGAGFFLNSDDQARADIIRKNFPNAQFGQDEEGRIVVRGSENEPYAYINAPGIGAQEAADFAGDVVKFAPAAKAVQGLGLIGRIAGGGGLAAATSGLSDLASGMFGSEQGIDYGKAAFAGAGQGAGELASTGLAATLRAFRKGPKPSGADLVNTIDGEAAKGAQRSIAGAQAADDLARTFDIPLSRGQATGSLEQQAFESRALRGAVGDSAQQTMERFAKRQAQSVNAAGREIAGERIAASPYEAGSIISKGLKSRAATLNAEIDNAYSAARAHNAKLSADALPNMVDYVTRSAPDEFRYLLDANPADAARSYPNATTAFRSTQRLVNEIQKKAAQKQGRVVAVDFQRIEAHRRLLNELGKDAKPSDARAVRHMKAALDGWLDSAVSNRLFDGDEAFLEAFKKARGLRAQYGRLYGADGAKDFAGKAIDDIVRNNPTPEETLNLLFGASKLGSKRGVAETVRQIKTATGGGDEFQALRDAAVDRIMSRGFGRGGDQMRIGTLIEQWDSALNKEGRSVMSELFEPKEVARMREYLTVLKQLEPKPGAVNTSNSAIEAARMARGLLGGFVKVPNLAVDRVLTGVADPNALRARTAIQGAPRPLPQLPSPASAVGPAVLPPFNDAREDN